jgi:hypothetical protein
MPPESDKHSPDMMGQFADMASFWMSLGNPYRSLMAALPTRYEIPDPTVQEIAILASMHNMASMLRNPEKIKTILSAEISERARKLAQSK